MQETFEEMGTTLELCEADLLVEGAFDDIIKGTFKKLNSINLIKKRILGCWGVIHVASPVAIGTPKDPQKELVDPAVQGTLNVLKACLVRLSANTNNTTQYNATQHHNTTPHNTTITRTTHTKYIHSHSLNSESKGTQSGNYFERGHNTRDKGKRFQRTL